MFGVCVGGDGVVWRLGSGSQLDQHSIDGRHVGTGSDSSSEYYTIPYQYWT